MLDIPEMLVDYNKPYFYHGKHLASTSIGYLKQSQLGHPQG